MSQTVSLDENDRNKIEAEIAQYQARVIQTLVPTILALGLLAIANPANIDKPIALGCAFAILFSSGLYVASLSYKIFMNATFLRTFSNIEPNKIYWEEAISEYRHYRRVLLFQSETATAAIIYAVLALTFLFIFYEVNPVASALGALLLLLVAFSIWMIYARRTSYANTWKDLKPHLERKAKNREL